MQVSIVDLIIKIKFTFDQWHCFTRMFVYGITSFFSLFWPFSLLTRSRVSEPNKPSSCVNDTKAKSYIRSMHWNLISVSQSICKIFKWIWLILDYYYRLLFFLIRKINHLTLNISTPTEWTNIQWVWRTLSVDCLLPDYY